MWRAGRTVGLRARRPAIEGRQIDFLAAYSTARKGTISRIVPKIEGPTTDPRADTQYVVTEFGIACMTGKSTAQRAEALIAIAHPEFREALRLGARQLGYL